MWKWATSIVNLLIYRKIDFDCVNGKKTSNCMRKEEVGEYLCYMYIVYALPTLCC